MIYIVTAMYAEAHAFIHRFQLKKESSHTRFQVFLNRNADICLIISGIGLIPAAAAVSSICTEYNPGQGDFLLNIGICGQIWKQTVHENRNACQRGRLFLCNKILEQFSGKTFYPDILYRHNFTEAQIVTGPKPYEKTVMTEIEEVDFYLYDMEAAAVYQAGAYYFGPHQICFLKIVSDNGDSGNVTSGQIEPLMNENMESLANYITDLQTIAHGECQNAVFQETVPQGEFAKLCLDMHCSRTMSESLRQYLHYCILSGVDYTSVLKEMYQKGKLPCKDKREGKLCFEEFKEKLL